MSHRTINRAVTAVVFLAIVSIFSTCSPASESESADKLLASRIALDWNRLFLKLEWHTPGYRPPVSARMFAYTEMAAYEAALPSMTGYVSFGNWYPGYQSPAFSAEHYFLPAALNAAYAHMAKAFFPTAPLELQKMIEELDNRNAGIIASKTDSPSIRYSIDFGIKTAEAVWNYSLQDSVGHDGFMYNFDRNFKPRSCAGCWQPDQERPIPALLPNWGNARTFVASKQEIVAKPPIAFDESTPSAYYAEALEIFSISNSRSSEAHWIAEFWSDDVPGLTVTPIGRWISIATQAIEETDISFPMIMETYLKTAMAMCDAAIICWDNKYKYQLERPEAFIRRNIQPDWSPLHSSPAFPGYPSGHAIFGAAAAEILTVILGRDFALTDRTHQGRTEFAGKPRTFGSFEEMANENAYSRVLMGVHFRMDCEEGLRLGKMIGQKVAAQQLRRVGVAALQSR